MRYEAGKTGKWAKGLSLIEILIAIGILAVSMMLIAAAFPAGVAMSIAVSDETTAQSVFQEALAEIKDNVGIGDFTPDGDNNLVLLPDGGCEREFGNGIFSWAALIRPVDDTATGVMGNLCQVIIIVSRKPSGNPNFRDNDDNDSEIPELRSVNCTASDDARTITIDSDHFDWVPNIGYIVDSETGIIYSMISRNDGASKTVTLLTEAPSDADIAGDRDFWVIPGPYDGSNYGQVSPGIRVFGATLYLP